MSKTPKSSTLTDADVAKCERCGDRGSLYDGLEVTPCPVCKGNAPVPVEVGKTIAYSSRWWQEPHPSQPSLDILAEMIDAALLADRDALLARAETAEREVERLTTEVRIVATLPVHASADKSNTLGWLKARALGALEKSND